LGLLESIRKWIDGETGEDLLEAADEHAKPRRVWEEFLVKIAREVEAAMQREMFTPPGGPTYIPREYIVYLSPEDDKDWQGDKRRGLEQGLFHVLSERARELSGTTQLAVKSFAVELRVDGTLNKGEFRVQAVWDETESGHTMVTPRVGQTQSDSQQFNPNDTVVERAGDVSSESEQTVVRAKAAALYSVEVWRDGVREAVVPITKNEITIVSAIIMVVPDTARMTCTADVSAPSASAAFSSSTAIETCRGRWTLASLIGGVIN